LSPGFQANPRSFIIMSSNPPPFRILVTNDDGIHAPGLEVLESIARELSDDVWVIAPSDECSGASHSVSLMTPIRMRQLDDRRFQVSGTPTDCVLMALWELMPDERPNVVLSGINAGANLAEDVTYSGTCAAAMEGTLAGIRSIALSQLSPNRSDVDFATAARHGPALVRQLLALDDWNRGSFFNVNFPHCPPGEVSGIRVTTQGQRPPGAFSIDPRRDSRNHPYFWVRIRYPAGDHPDESDLAAVNANEISVTPVRMDLTDHSWKESLGQRLT
jgi:5'-nucleotidase